MPLNDYELERQKRIQENRARMAQFGLTQASDEFVLVTVAFETITDIKAVTVNERAAARQAKAARRAALSRANVSSTSCPPLPRRRSGRVKGEDAPDYDGSIIDAADSRSFSTNYQEELYTIEHVRALGSWKMPWVCFQDGYDEKGNKILDKVHGRTCHQCRQKYLGKRTSCSHCQSLQGQFCGDCLFQRYGENLDEANENRDWKCPGCNGMCNCSFHRSKRGWAPTGTMFPHADALGFLSVSHYLVLNNLEPGAREEALPLMPPELAEEIKAELAEEKAEKEAAAATSTAAHDGKDTLGKETETGDGAEAVTVAAPETENHDELQKGTSLEKVIIPETEAVGGIKRKATGIEEDEGNEAVGVGSEEVLPAVKHARHGMKHAGGKEQNGCLETVENII